MHRVRTVALAFIVFAGLASCATPKAPMPAPAPAPAPDAAAPPIKINDAGLAIIKNAEGLRLSPYEAGDGWYVGYGHAIEGPGPAIDQAQADALLRKDVALCERKIGALVTVPVNTNEFSAMVSLCYNLGWQSFGASSIVKRLNAGDRQGAADAFLFYDKATVNGEKQTLPRLHARREKERALFLQGA